MASIPWLADELRAAGLTVVEHAGWKSRTVGGAWNPTFGVVHATAAPRSQSDATQVRIVRDGRSDLRGPIANACVDRQGRWHVLAAGRCNTTLVGTAGPYRGVGNTGALGVEACNDNGRHKPAEPWPDHQYEAYARGWASICRRLRWNPSRLRGHKEHTPAHKTDPTFSMPAFRSRVDHHMAQLAKGNDMDVSELDGAPIRPNRTLGGTLDALARGLHDEIGRDAAIMQALAGIAAKVDLDPSEIEQIRAAVPSAEQVAEAVAARLGSVGTAADKARLLAPLLGADARAVGMILAEVDES